MTTKAPAPVRLDLVDEIAREAVRLAGTGMSQPLIEATLKSTFGAKAKAGAARSAGRIGGRR